MRLAAICMCERVPKSSLLFPCNKTGDIPDFRPAARCKHPSRLQEEQKMINKRHQHCESALLVIVLPVQPLCSLTSGEPFSALCSCSTSPLFFGWFFFFFWLFAPSPWRVSPKTAKPASHNELWGFLCCYGALFAPRTSLVHTAGTSQMSAVGALLRSL